MAHPDRGQVINRAENRDGQAQSGDARQPLYSEALTAREIGSDNAALRTAPTFVASLPAGRPAMRYGCVPIKKGTLQMTSASRLSPMVHLALQCLARSFFRIENVVSVRLSNRTRALLPAAYARSCTSVFYDNDVNPGFHDHEAEGTALNIHDVTGSAHSRVIERLKSTKPQAGFDQDMTEPQEKPQKPNHHRRMDSFPRYMTKRRLTLMHISCKCDIQNYKM
eukprot:9468085-Pyramimonas_sp.AAC.1